MSRDRTRAAVAGLALVAVSAAGAAADHPVAATLPASFDRAWAAAGRGLLAEGWTVDLADAPTGTLSTGSRRLQGDAGGIHARARRVRLTLELTPAGPDRTRVSVRRQLFERERALWVERDRALVSADALGGDHVERRVLDAIRRAL